MKHLGLEQELAAVLHGLHIELDDLSIQTSGRKRAIRITVDGDGPHGSGLDLDQIAEATRAISQALDETDVLDDAPYTLEVSSRGVSRPLTKPAHYRRNRARLVNLSLADGSSVTGRIVDADDKGVALDVNDAIHTVAFDKISAAHIQI